MIYHHLDNTDSPTFQIALCFPVAAALPMTYGTSLYALKQRAELKAGETLAVAVSVHRLGEEALERLPWRGCLGCGGMRSGRSERGGPRERTCAVAGERGESTASFCAD